MLQFERQQQILEFLRQEHSASIKKIARQIFTSESSVRRDVDALERKGFVTKIYGGVVLAEHKNDVVPVALRDSISSAAKERIAQRAAQMVFDGAVILMDSSSTVRRICKYLGGFRDLTIITNNQNIFNECTDKSICLYCTGGRFDPVNNTFVGPSAEEYVRKIHADILFFSMQGLAEDGDITDVSEAETSLRSVMLQHATKKVFLCDASKLGVKKHFKLCNRKDIDEIICDAPLPWENANLSD